MYDNPAFWDYTTIGRGKNVCNNVCINLLGGSTVEWMKSSLPEDSMGGGFFSRLIPVYRLEAGRKIPHPEDVLYAGSGLIRDNLINDLKAIADLQGPFTWTPKAKVMFSDWYMDYNFPEREAPQLRGYYGRKGDTLIKLSMICSASHESSKRITERDFEFAKNLLDENEVFMKKLTSVMGQTDEGGRIDQVLYYIKRAGKGGLKHSDLQHATSHKFNKITLQVCIDTLAESKVISKGFSGKGTVYTYTGE
jgi:hypothetical protein